MFLFLSLSQDWLCSQHVQLHQCVSFSLFSVSPNFFFWQDSLRIHAPVTIEILWSATKSWHGDRHRAHGTSSMTWYASSGSPSSFNTVSLSARRTIVLSVPPAQLSRQARRPISTGDTVHEDPGRTPSQCPSPTPSVYWKALSSVPQQST